MPRGDHTNAEREFGQDAEFQAEERLPYCLPFEPHLSDSNEEVAGRRLSDPEGKSSIQALDERRGHRCNEYGEPQSPPPPYSEHDQHVAGGDMLPNEHFNFYPGEGGRAVYITDGSGRCERYVERVPWPLPDHIDSSDDGDGAHLESGRIIPRSEWEDDHEWYPSSDEPPSDNTDAEYQSHRYPMPRTTPHIGLQNRSYPIVRLQGPGVDIAPHSDGAVDNVNQDAKDGPTIALERGLATRIPYQDIARAIISNGLFAASFYH